MEELKMLVYNENGELVNEFVDKKTIYLNLLERLINKYIGESKTYKVKSKYYYDNTYDITFIDNFNGYEITYKNIDLREIGKGVL